MNRHVAHEKNKNHSCPVTPTKGNLFGVDDFRGPTKPAPEGAFLGDTWIHRLL